MAYIKLAFYLVVSLSIMISYNNGNTFLQGTEHGAIETVALVHQHSDSLGEVADVVTFDPT